MTEQSHPAFRSPGGLPSRPQSASGSEPDGWAGESPVYDLGINFDLAPASSPSAGSIELGGADAPLRAVPTLSGGAASEPPAAALPALEDLPPLAPAPALSTPPVVTPVVTPVLAPLPDATEPAAHAPSVPTIAPLPQRPPSSAATGPVAPSVGAGQAVPQVAPPASTAGVQKVEIQGSAETESAVDLDELLQQLVQLGGSDLHLSAGSVPAMRLNGEIQVLRGGFPRLSPEQIEKMMKDALNTKQRQTFEETDELDFAYTVPGVARFRVNLFKQRGSIGAVMRVIPWDILTVQQLGLPPLISDFANLPRGLVLITGPTGSGKSTTLAAIIDHANRTRHGHIMTIEDPIEFLHQNRECLVNQREVGTDTTSFPIALRQAMRQDPDIILLGELRDLETISTALTAAETGHLVFATLHTQSAQETVSRIVDAFPAGQQAQVRAQLSAALQAVVCQTLLPRADKQGRVACLEIMKVNVAIRSHIRENKLNQIASTMQTTGAEGNQTRDAHLAELIRTGLITAEVGYEVATDSKELHQLVSGSRNVGVVR